MDTLQYTSDKQSAKKIRVLIVVSGFRFSRAGQKAVSLLRNINRNKYEVLLASLSGKNHLQSIAQELEIPYINLSLQFNSLFQGLLQWKNSIRQFDPHCIHSFSFEANLLARITRIFSPWVTIISEISPFPGKGYHVMYSLMDRLTRCLDTMQVVNSSVAKDFYLNTIHLSPQKVTLIYDGIDIIAYNEKEFFMIRDRIRREFHLEKHHLVIGLVASFCQEEQTGLLLRTLASLKDSYPGIRLLVFNRDEQETAWRALAEQEDMADRVIFTGDRLDVRNILCGIDIFSSVSEMEEDTVSLLTAMEVGLPVIVACSDEVSEILAGHKNGLLFTPGNLDEFVDQLKKLLESSHARQNMGQRARQRIIEHYSSARMTKEYQLVYDKCFSMRKLS